MISTEHIGSLQGATVVGANGERIGGVGQVLVDTQTGQPEWVTVKTGFFGTNETLVPITDAAFQGDELTVPFTKDQIKAAPHIGVDQDLSQQDEAQLYAHYGLHYSTNASGSGLPTGGPGGPGAGYGAGLSDLGTPVRDETDTFGDDTDVTSTSGQYAGTAGYAGSDDAMTRSEERLHVGTEQVETGRARLRKYVETEQVNVPVTVTKEKVRLETEPITDANRDAAFSGPDISEAEHEVTLTEERPVVAKETVPVERVRLAKETVTEEQTVSDSVRKERISTDGVDDVYPDETRVSEDQRHLR